MTTSTRKQVLGRQEAHALGRWWLTIALMGILLIGYALRIYTLGASSLWFDEIMTYNRANVSFLEVMHRSFAPPWQFAQFDQIEYGNLFPVPVHFVHFLIVHFALYLGNSEFILRFPAVVFGLLTISLLFRFGKEFLGIAEGLLGAYLLSISRFHIHYSREARYYSFFVFFSLLSSLSVLLMESD